MAKKDSAMKINNTVEAVKPTVNVAQATPSTTQMSSAPKTAVQDSPVTAPANKKK